LPEAVTGAIARVKNAQEGGAQSLAAAAKIGRYPREQRFKMSCPRPSHQAPVTGTRIAAQGWQGLARRVGGPRRPHPLDLVIKAPSFSDQPVNRSAGADGAKRTDSELDQGRDDQGRHACIPSRLRTPYNP
jgi:hypothetical protein